MSDEQTPIEPCPLCGASIESEKLMYLISTQNTLSAKGLLPVRLGKPMHDAADLPADYFTPSY